MNKAFIREPDDTGQGHCPACGSLGIAVERETWQAHVRRELAAGLAEAAFFCPFPRCDVVYFDMFERRVTSEALNEPVYPKDPHAPVCACFGLTADEIETDARAGDVTRVRELLKKAESGQALCRTKAASGRPCTADVQREYLKARGGS